MSPFGPVVGVEWLVEHLDHDPLRVVDTRWYLGKPGAGRAAYDAGHIPGASFLDLDDDLSLPAGAGRHPLPPPEIIAERLGAAGIGDRNFVVAYDDVGGQYAARLWWMLRSIGHRRTGVLDGGMQAWRDAGGESSTKTVEWPPATLSILGGGQTIDRDGLAARLGDVTLIDARAPERYRGETEPIDPVAGHIPTAVSAPYADNLGPDGHFLAPAELRQRFESIAGGSGTVVVSCGSGTSACHHSVAMRAAGLPDPILYVGSYSDWTRSGAPVVTGPEPGEALR